MVELRLSSAELSAPVVRRSDVVTAQEALSARLPALITALDSTDAVEGVHAFQEKRLPSGLAAEVRR